MAQRITGAWDVTCRKYGNELVLGRDADPRHIRFLCHSYLGSLASLGFAGFGFPLDRGSGGGEGEHGGEDSRRVVAFGLINNQDSRPGRQQVRLRRARNFRWS